MAKKLGSVARVIRRSMRISVRTVSKTPPGLRPSPLVLTELNGTVCSLRRKIA